MLCLSPRLPRFALVAAAAVTSEALRGDSDSDDASHDKLTSFSGDPAGDEELWHGLPGELVLLAERLEIWQWLLLIASLSFAAGAIAIADSYASQYCRQLAELLHEPQILDPPDWFVPAHPVRFLPWLSGTLVSEGRVVFMTFLVDLTISVVLVARRQLLCFFFVILFLSVTAFLQASHPYALGGRPWDALKELRLTVRRGGIATTNWAGVRGFGAIVEAPGCSLAAPLGLLCIGGVLSVPEAILGLCGLFFAAGAMAAQVTAAQFGGAAICDLRTIAARSTLEESWPQPYASLVQFVVEATALFAIAGQLATFAVASYVLHPTVVLVALLPTTYGALYNGRAKGFSLLEAFAGGGEGHSVFGFQSPAHPARVGHLAQVLWYLLIGIFCCVETETLVKIPKGIVRLKHEFLAPANGFINGSLPRDQVGGAFFRTVLLSVSFVGGIVHIVTALALLLFLPTYGTGGRNAEDKVLQAVRDDKVAQLEAWIESLEFTSSELTFSNSSANSVRELSKPEPPPMSRSKTPGSKTQTVSFTPSLVIPERNSEHDYEAVMNFTLTTP